MVIFVRHNFCFMKLRWYLAPLSWLYGFGVYIRNCFFDWGWKKTRTFKTAVISVGNITVGGTGKTPHVEYLLSLLQQQFQVAMVSRGYRRQSKGLQVADANSTSLQLGDEPYQIYRKYPQTVVIADANRCRAIDYIASHHPAVDAVVLDDAFQHRYVSPGMSILLVDYHRLITKDALLPCGNLRESAMARYRASVIVVTKCPSDIKPIELRTLYKELSPRPYQRIYYTYYQYGPLRAVFGEHTQALSANMAVLLVAGIAQPQPLQDYLSEQVASVDAVLFSDHHYFTQSDWLSIQRQFEAKVAANKYIVVTEKDAARLLSNDCVPVALQPYIFALPIEVQFMQDKAKEFNQLVIDYVSKNKRNSSLPNR